MTAIYDGKTTHTERFLIGDTARMIASVMAFDGHPAVNTYVPWVVWRHGLPIGRKGAEADVVAVLAAVADLDGDKGVKAELPVEPSYVVETSPGNAQAFFIFPHPLTVHEAKPALCALADAVGGDSATKDCSHIWRIPGTLNIPTKSKLARGRSPEPAPVVVQKAANGRLIDASELLALAPAAELGKARGKTREQTREPTPLSTAEEAKLRDGLGSIPADDRDVWLRVGMALHLHGAARLWDDWSRTSPKYDQAGQAKAWDSFKADRDDKITTASIFATAKEHGWKSPCGKGAGRPSKKPVELPLSEDALALALVERHGSELRFVAAWGKWFHWRSGCWGPEKTLIAFDLTRKMCRGAPTLKEPSNDSV